MADQTPKPSQTSQTPAPDSYPKLSHSIFNMEKRDDSGGEKKHT